MKLIVVMGHTSCGAVKGAVDNVKLGNLTALLAQIEPAIVAVGGPRGTSKDHAYVDKVAEANVRHSMKQTHDKSPVLGDAESGALGLVGAMYDVETGKVVFSAD